ncbi:MAG: exonuclease SbcCD subunit D [Gracilibacteraceae bacterium]|jgi:exonuclease SbcD|nr:exonuclease SbcCD subunit D [Gracilibacteraceae bacterium]
MEFLHLADLHIGKSVNGFSMLHEQKHAFAQIIKYIQTKHPAAVVIAGDIYDRAVPGVEAVRLFDDFLTELAGEDTAIMLISGNHDSPERLNYASRLLTDKQVYLYTAFDGALRKIVLTDAYGDVNFWLLPFIRPSCLREQTGEPLAETYDDAIAMVLAAANVDYAARNVLVAHQFFTKPDLTPARSESELSPVGGLDAVNAELIEGFDYAALGHLHGTQPVEAPHIRYAGSPIKYSFSEWLQEKSVTLVNLQEKGTLTITPLPLIPLHDMRQIRGTINALMGDSQCRDPQSPSPNDYLRVILTDEEEIVDPMGKLRSVYPNIMSLAFENTRTRIHADTITQAKTTDVLSPYDLFNEFFLDLHGATMSTAQAEIVRELLEREEEP